MQDLGSHELGRWGGLVRAQVWADRLWRPHHAAAFSSADARAADAADRPRFQDRRAGGFALGGQLTYAWARPISAIRRSTSACAPCSRPSRRPIRSCAAKPAPLRGAIGIDVIDQDIEFGGCRSEPRSPAGRHVRLGGGALGLAPGDPHYTPAEPVWRIGGEAEVRQGFGILGASDPCGPTLAACLLPGVVPPTRLEGDPTALVLRGSFSGEVRPTPRLTFALAARGQYSAHPLYSFEEFSAGNYTEGRGYDPGALLGDSGIGIQAELRYGTTLPRQANRFAAEPYVFFDHAWVWNQDRLFVIPEQQLSSIGAGVRAAYGDRIRLDLAIAVPLDRTTFQTKRGDPRILLTLTTRLWPWRSR